MAVYAIGDVQGCLAPFRQLLENITFDPTTDQLWLAGDLVNRGPDSLATLRFVKGLGTSVKAVLGNHDLHLLQVAAGIKGLKERDTLNEILTAPDREELLFWLRHLPLAHRDDSLKTIMIHGGVYLRWGPNKVMRYAHEFETILRSSAYRELLRNIYPGEPRQWHKTLSGWPRYRFIGNSFTRLRYLSPNGALDFDFKAPPDSHPPRLIPWFRHPERRCRKWRLIFGHWAAMGHFRKKNLIALDSGCVWGKKLTAVRLDTPENLTWQVDCMFAPQT